MRAEFCHGHFFFSCSPCSNLCIFDVSWPLFFHVCSFFVWTFVASITQAVDSFCQSSPSTLGPVLQELYSYFQEEFCYLFVDSKARFFPAALRLVQTMDNASRNSLVRREVSVC